MQPGASDWRHGWIFDLGQIATCLSSGVLLSKMGLNDKTFLIILLGIVSASVCARKCVSMCVPVCACMCVCMCVCPCAHVHVCARVRVHVCACACVCVCVCVRNLDRVDTQ